MLPIRTSGVTKENDPGNEGNALVFSVKNSSITEKKEAQYILAKCSQEGRFAFVLSALLMLSAS